jgi:hypothetical protein
VTSDSSFFGINIEDLQTATAPTSTHINALIVNKNPEPIRYYEERWDGNKTVECDWALEPYNITYDCFDNVHLNFYCR